MGEQQGNPPQRTSRNPRGSKFGAEGVPRPKPQEAKHQSQEGVTFSRPASVSHQPPEARPPCHPQNQRHSTHAPKQHPRQACRQTGERQKTAQQSIRTPKRPAEHYAPGRPGPKAHSSHPLPDTQAHGPREQDQAPPHHTARLPRQRPQRSNPKPPRRHAGHQYHRECHPPTPRETATSPETEETSQTPASSGDLCQPPTRTAPKPPSKAPSTDPDPHTPNHQPAPGGQPSKK
ncbi:uncharacterized protein LOC129186240 [Dunckerocampus dactyliophorus]|uniref:uncharacterized protein LOC129186240 n=1 Tax=Dunckerocampus dactyliophorus TaxID=161453 RepID=UPI0024055881|nr:uncharacterized protein LOC129186240 [Dunckerocampus dactyliophorus]